MVFDVAEYWEGRYASGGNSGNGSRGQAAKDKAAVVNEIIASRGLHTVIDWGCGDGKVASLIKAGRYIGLDVSKSALEKCSDRAAEGNREWLLYDGINPPDLPRGDLALSLDVLFHLVDEQLYRRHLELVFGSARFVCIASSNRDEPGLEHVLHRRFIEDVPDGWKVIRRPENEHEIGIWLFRRAR